MASILIDFQGFQLNDLFLIKELSFYCPKLNFVKSFFFRSSIPFQKLSFKEKKIVWYCEKHYHKIPYSFGELSQSNLHSVFETFVNSNTIVYAKGESKVKILKNILPKNDIFNIEEYGCSKLSKDSYMKEDDNCNAPFHEASLHCSHRNAHVYGRFLKSLLNNE